MYNLDGIAQHVSPFQGLCRYQTQPPKRSRASVFCFSKHVSGKCHHQEELFITQQNSKLSKCCH